ncbi:MAG: barstar family protein [Duganella sp.]
MTRKSLITIDLTKISSIDELFPVLSDALDFPSWCGENWNAFWDAITEIVEMPEHIQLNGWSAFENRFPENAAERMLG